MINSNYDKYNLLFEAVVINLTRPKRPLIRWLRTIRKTVMQERPGFAWHCFAVLAVIIGLLATSADSKAGGENINTLPWEIIAEKFDAKKPFCTAKSKDEKINDFALGPDALIMTLPSNIQIPQEQTKAELGLSIWQQDQWVDLAPLTVHINPNGLRVGTNAIAEGFYNLSVVFDKNDIGKENIFHAVVATDWKKDLLAWCRKNKEQIETNPDSQLLRSSIAVSHFDHVMGFVSNSQALSERILSALANAVIAKRVYAEGNCPDFVVGLNKLRFKRFEGAKFAQFELHVPANYDSSQKWPVFAHIDTVRVNIVDHLHSDGSNGNPLYEKMLYLLWSSVTHKNMQWKDYLFLMEMIRKKYNIDNDRVYLFGYCQFGLATIALALNHPDEWAECVSFTGNSFRNLAGNALNLSVKFGNAHPAIAEQTAYFQFAVKCFKYNNCRHFECAGLNSIVPWRRDWDVPQSKRISSPKFIQYTIESLQSPKAYWITVLGREDENYIARIETSVDGQEIILNRNNIDAYQINLRLAPLDHTRPVTIIDNEKSIAVDPMEVFTYRGSKYDQAAYVKNRQLHGPICDAFTDAYTVLYTTGIDAKETEQIEVIAKRIAGTGPCLPENELSEEIIQNHNLILIGRTGKCQFLSKISDSLPLQIDKSVIVFEDQTVTGDVGLMMVYPNPKNSKKYIALFLGGSNRTIKRIPVIWENDLKKAQADIAIFKVSSDNKHEFIRLEKFNTVWNWHEHWSQPLVSLSEKYSKWRWRQWVGHVIRKQLDADIAICEDIFRGDEKPDQKKITLRDLDRVFNDKWFVKIKLNGKELITLLTKFVVMKDLSKSKAIRPVIDGVSFVKGMAGPDYMLVSQIKEDQYYMVGLPEKLVNGSRVGLILKDYEIVGEGYQIQLLQDYLKSRKHLELDSELKKMKLTIM